MSKVVQLTDGVYVEVQAQGTLMGPTGFVRIPGITSATVPNLTANELATTAFEDDSHTSQPGLPKWGDVSISCFANPQSYHEGLLKEMARNRQTRNWKVGRDGEVLLAAGATSARSVQVAAPLTGAAAVATFGGSDYSDIREVELLGVGAVIKVSSQLLRIIGHLSATTASVVTLNGTSAVSAVTGATAYDILRAKYEATFRGWLSNLSSGREVDGLQTNDITVMISGDFNEALTEN